MKRCPWAALLLLVGTTVGCAAKAATHFSAKDVAKAHIDPRHCHDIPNTGDIMCNRVRVTLATVPVK